MARNQQRRTPTGDSVTAELARALFRQMLLVRRFEERVGDLYAAGTIPGFVHLSIGQEAVSVGVCSTLRPDDFLTTTHRGHGHVLAKGADPARMLAELLGRSGGYCSGRGGSMHVMAADIGVLGANGIVGAGMPIATGAALTARHRGKGQVAVAFFGDGAVGSGSFHEALNLAAVLQLPMVFACENNGYAEMTPYEVHSRVATVADRAAAYGVPALRVDGNDVLAVRAAAADAVTRARDGGGPTLLEATTYRWRGHYEGDRQTYRTKEEVAEWQSRDPIARFGARAESAGWLGRQEAEEVRAAVEATMESAVSWALASPEPLPESLLENVYA